MSVEGLLLQLMTGIVVGAIWVIVALGLSLIFGILRIVNFAHGAFYMLGAYLAALAVGWTGSFWMALLLAPAAMAAFGLVAQSGLIRPLYQRGLVYSVLITYAVSLVIIEGVKMLWGTVGPQYRIPRELAGMVTLGFVVFPKYRLFVLAATGLTVLGLWWLLHRTSTGLFIRAASQDPLMTQALGVDISRVLAVAFALGVALAGLGGALAGPLRGVFPEMGLDILVESFVVVVIGGMGSLTGAAVAGLLVGIVQSFTFLWAPLFAHVVLFLLMIATLLVRPHGLLGTE
ncbi:MAG: branched-chain amino acid ABC transporter permease [Armatimonadota bacterium]|nr:branched-chain amino acid ABC transporter permease [Armatimonadota bacterium]MDR7485745.1 branched-chain amino acid ABC transporter permease [Armatimonadota bacterium]MDR7537576.1 branched-chain amino acid ABC transporter permease [Armatimonadota bacterium]